MANIKTIKELTIPKTKAEKLLEWIIKQPSTPTIQKALGKKRSGTWAVVKKMEEKLAAGYDEFEVLSSTLKVSELNGLITAYNESKEEIEKKNEKHAPQDQKKAQEALQEKMINEMMDNQNKKEIKNVNLLLYMKRNGKEALDKNNKQVTINVVREDSESLLDFSSRILKQVKNLEKQGFRWDKSINDLNNMLDNMHEEQIEIAVYLSELEGE
ncbi:hypothetical protein HB968_14110 [Listeria welshimeri]|nr:hypothetical protein [Listeria welshimeri]